MDTDSIPFRELHKTNVKQTLTWEPLEFWTPTAQRITQYNYKLNVETLKYKHYNTIQVYYRYRAGVFKPARL